MYANSCETLLSYTNSSKSADPTTILLFQTSTDHYKYHVRYGGWLFMELCWTQSKKQTQAHTQRQRETKSSISPVLVQHSIIFYKNYKAHSNLKWSPLIRQELLKQKFTKPPPFSGEGQGLPGGDAEVPPTEFCSKYGAKHKNTLNLLQIRSIQAMTLILLFKMAKNLSGS